jgi:polyhydroxyalkanoate synthesis regulator phasin
MSNLFEKTINLGFGLFSYSREKIEEIVEELADKGEIAKKDAKQFTADLIKKGQEERNEFQRIIKEEVTSVLTNVNVATKNDIISKDELKEIIREQLVMILKEEGIIKSKNKSDTP